VIVFWSFKCPTSRLILLILLSCTESSPVWCQTSRIQDELNSAYKGQIRLLRNFYSGNDLEYDQSGALLSGGIPGPWTLADVEIKGIMVTAQGIEILGNRMGTWFRYGKPSFVKISKLKIHLARPVSDADTEATLQPIFRKIFTDPGEDLRPMVPDFWKYYLGGTDSKSRSAASRATLEENKIPIAKAGDASARQVTAPRVVYSPDPDYPKEARSHHIEGVSRLGTVIDATGAAGNIAILEPVGMGLDEQAVLAIKQWKFRPAMKNGQPVRVQINVEVAFRCC